MTEANGTTDSAERALKQAIQTLNMLNGGKAPLGEINNAIARNVMLEDIGAFGQPNQIYGLSDEDRDRLLVHARQDAANAMISASNALTEIISFKRAVKWWMLSAMLATVTWIAISRI